MTLMSDLLLSCWIAEAGRSAAMAARGQQASSVQAAARARILASACHREGVRIIPNFATRHSEYLRQVAGTDEETGALGMIVLQRLAAFVDAHTKPFLSDEEHARLVALGQTELDEVNMALMSGRLFPPPPAEWPSAEEKRAPGKVLTRFGILGDPHVGLIETNESLITALKQIAAEGADFVVANGDLTKSGEQDQFHTARKIFDGSEVPVLVTLGNHDMWGGEEESLGMERFRAAFDVEPYGEHWHNGVRVIVLNSADPRRNPFPPFDMMTGDFKDAPRNTVPGGTFSEETISWLRTLEPAGPTFITVHHPLYPYLGVPPLLFGLDEASTAHLAELAVRVDAKAIFAGHSHRCYLSYLDDVPVFELASASDWPFGYNMVEVTDQGWSLNLRPIDYEPDLDPMSHRDYLFRRHAISEPEARAFVALNLEE
ncbi:MAG TPA: metallophosphoesterase [Actinomycetota bacterium]|nr:metallophosphoesterase [Actinomycetota bacterium]